MSCEARASALHSFINVFAKVVQLLVRVPSIRVIIPTNPTESVPVESRSPWPRRDSIRLREKTDD